jgi:hypothetical protein
MGILVYNDQPIEQREADGMVSLTQMARANGVMVGHWRENAGTEDFLASLSRIIGKPITNMVSSDRQNGTWAIPEVSIHFAQWVSSDFHAWCILHIHRLITTGSTSMEAFRVPTLKQQVDDACFVLDSVYASVVEPCRLALRKHHTVARISPTLAKYLEGAESLLPSAPSEDQTFTPTEIGKMLEPQLSAVKLNKLLEERGYQENLRTAKGKVHWVPTVAGKLHCVVTLDSKANGDPVESVRWKKSIVSELVEAIA